MPKPPREPREKPGLDGAYAKRGANRLAATAVQRPDNLMSSSG
jgi:hypothetical protein